MALKKETNKSNYNGVPAFREGLLFPGLMLLSGVLIRGMSLTILDVQIFIYLFNHPFINYFPVRFCFPALKV